MSRKRQKETYAQKHFLKVIEKTDELGSLIADGAPFMDSPLKDVVHGEMIRLIHQMLCLAEEVYDLDKR